LTIKYTFLHWLTPMAFHVCFVVFVVRLCCRMLAIATTGIQDIIPNMVKCFFVHL
jgi:hypothetical protein